MTETTNENSSGITTNNNLQRDLQQDFHNGKKSAAVTPKEESIGATLRQKREKMNMEIKDVSHRLKVKISDLEALENDDLKSVTKHLYIPGLVDSYSRILRLDQKLMEQKIRKLPIRSNTDNKEHQLINIGEESDLTPSKELMVNAFLAVVLMMLALLSIYHSCENRDDMITNKQLISEIENS